jgi:hypothetical protein
MSKARKLKFVTTGHEEILTSLQQKYRLKPLQTFRTWDRKTACTLATNPANEQVFVTIKGYEKNSANSGKFARVLTRNRMAAKIKDNIVPRLLELKGFERNGAFWLVTIRAWAGQPLSRRNFFDGDGADVSEDTLKHIRHVLEVIPKTPSVGIFNMPHTISAVIRREFGDDVAFAASEWTSAHCDFHWGNIVSGGRKIIDWDDFSLAPKGFDAASIVLYSAIDMELFHRMRRLLSDMLSGDSARVATLFAAARILHLMRLGNFAEMRAHDIRNAVHILIQDGAQ